MELDLGLELGLWVGVRVGHLPGLIDLHIETVHARVRGARVGHGDRPRAW